MIQIISGTNRQGSRTLQVAKHVLALYKNHTQDVELLDLSLLPYDQLAAHPYGSPLPPVLHEAVEKINNCSGLVIICPEYNGSMPGALKFFIDHWSYPKSFEGRPVCFVGLGFRWGGLRPVEHLQGIFSYRNAYMFPERVFITNIGDTLKDGKIVDANVQSLLEKQTQNFLKFIKALKTAGLC